MRSGDDCADRRLREVPSDLGILVEIVWEQAPRVSGGSPNVWAPRMSQAIAEASAPSLNRGCSNSGMPSRGTKARARGTDLETQRLVRVIDYLWINCNRFERSVLLHSIQTQHVDIRQIDFACRKAGIEIEGEIVAL